jgi:hemerythrin-like domain-containing protein
MKTSTIAPASPPDVESYRRVHRVLRISAGQLLDALARPADATTTAALARWYRGYAGEIKCHHHIEDALLFPALAARVATYGAYAPKLESDHVELDELLDDLGRALNGGDRSAALPLAQALKAHLDEHLGFEDDEIVPMFARHFTAVEFEELNTKAVRMTSLRQMSFTAPWMLSQLDTEQRARLLASVPKALHVLWFLTRRRYARLARRALSA